MLEQQQSVLPPPHQRELVLKCGLCPLNLLLFFSQLNDLCYYFSRNFFLQKIELKLEGMQYKNPNYAKKEGNPCYKLTSSSPVLPSLCLLWKPLYPVLWLQKPLAALHQSRWFQWEPLHVFLPLQIH